MNNTNIDVSFNSKPTAPVQFRGPHVMSVNIGNISANKIHYNTTENWNKTPTLIAQAGHIYCYSDWKIDSEGRPIVGIKIGDGKAYLMDMPFTDELWAEHIADAIIHVSEQDRDFWNNKVRCYIHPDHDDELVFTTE